MMHSQTRMIVLPSSFQFCQPWKIQRDRHVLAFRGKCADVFSQAQTGSRLPVEKDH